jgi:hypothetical protein
MVDGINDNVSGQRHIVAADGDGGDVLDSVRSSSPLSAFQVAVVVDVIYDPSLLTEKDKASLKESVANPEMVDRMSRKSILARIISRNADHADNRPQIFLPGIPHDHMPLKVTEQCFVFFTDPVRSQRYGFWLWRCPEPLDVEDVNFAHGDRRQDQNSKRTTAERAQGNDPDPPGFSNGSGDVDGFTLQGERDYDDILDKAKATAAHVNEPVPRFSPRPGDRVLQGSNNARIVLGMDRTGAATDAPRAFSGTIDMVVGVGSEPTDENAPKIVANSRGDNEVDKTPSKRSDTDNPQEGDPNYDTDKSRVYASMSTDADKLFKIDIDGVINVPGNNAAIVFKSDQLRNVARDDYKLVAGDSALVMNSSGVKLITPNGTIHLGSALAASPVVKGDELIKAFTSFTSTVAGAGASHAGAQPPTPIANGAYLVAITSATAALAGTIANWLSTTSFTD